MINTSTGQSISPASAEINDATAGANTIVTITLAALDGHRRIAHHIQWSYSAAPTGGRLFVEDGVGTTILDVDIIAGGQGSMDLFLPGSINTALVFNLAAGSGAIVGKLNCQTTRYSE